MLARQPKELECCLAFILVFPRNPIGRPFSDILCWRAWRWASRCPTCGEMVEERTGSLAADAFVRLDRTQPGAGVLDNFQGLLNNASSYPSCWSASSLSATCVAAWRLMTGALRKFASKRSCRLLSACCGVSETVEEVCRKLTTIA